VLSVPAVATAMATSPDFSPGGAGKSYAIAAIEICAEHANYSVFY
jgi:hypothetical protein